MDMREARSESGAFGCDAPLGTTQQSPAPGFDAVSQHDVVAVVVAEPLSAKIRDRQHGDQVFNTSTQQHLEPKNEDSSFAQTYSSKDIDSWRRSVALRNSTTWTAGVASTTHHEPLSPQHTNATYGIDIEKQSLRASSRSSQQTTPTGLVERGGAVYISYRVPLVDGCDAEDHTPWILLYLCFLSLPLTIFIALYTILTLSFILLLFPLSLCTRRKPLRQQIAAYLLPPLDYQLYCLYHAGCPSDLDHNDGGSSNATDPRSLLLVAISVLSPLYSVAITLAVWVTAFFWIYDRMLDVPNRFGQNDNDGRKAVLTVRKWWCDWLSRSIEM